MRLTRISARNALWVGKGILVHVDPISREKRPAAAWSFGGTVAGTPEHVAFLKEKFGATGFEGELGRRDDDPYDLSCFLPQRSWSPFEKWLNKEQSTLDIVGTARNEINQEFPDMKLSSHLAEAVQYGTFKRFDVRGILHTYTGEEVKRAMCYTYVVQCTVPSRIEGGLAKLVDDSEDLYLITRADVRRRFIWGALDGRRSKILVPKALGLLFK